MAQSKEVARSNGAVKAANEKKSSTQQNELDAQQTLRAANALLRKIQSDDASKKSTAKPSLLDDADEEDVADEVPIWLILTTKKHIIDKQRLKPGKIQLPHPYLDATDASLRVCLITIDPQRKYKDLIADPSFPAELSQRIQRVIDIKKLKAKYKTFESKRHLFSEYDVFLADDRIVTQLPQTLGKVFYKSGSKRPIPIVLDGKRQNTDEQGNKRIKLSEGGSKVIRDEARPADIGREIQRTLHSALVHLAPSTTTAVKVGIASMSAEHVQENIDTVVNAMVERFVPQKWSNLRSVHIKGPNTAALPIWLTEELWQDEQDVLEEAPPAKEGRKKRTREALDGGNADAASNVIEVPGGDGQMRRIERPSSKRKSLESKSTNVEAAPTQKKQKKTKEDDTSTADAQAKAQLQQAEKKEKSARKAALQQQKSAAKAKAGK